MGRPPSEVRDKIVSAAVRVLRLAGRARFSQTEVAKEAEIPQGHLTYYFPRRTDLVVAASRWQLESTLREMQRFVDAAAAQRGPRSRVRALLAYSARLVKDRARTRMMLALLLEADATPELRDLLRDNTLLIRGGIATALGLPSDDPDVDIVLAVLWGLGMQHVTFGERRTGAEVDAILARLEQVLGGAPGRRAAGRRSERAGATRAAPGRRNG
jgi:AcrR family transcriptional regulator